MVIFDSVKAPGEFNIQVSFHTFTPAHLKKKDDHRSLPVNLAGGAEMDTGSDFCRLVHKPVETPNYNLDCSPANPTPYEPLLFKFTGFKMADFGADSPLYSLPGTPNGNMNSLFMSHGAGVLEDVSTCLCYISCSLLITMDSLDLPSSPGKPFKMTCGPAQQASFACEKNDPIKKATK
jgi:hypothetical protein